MARRVSCPTLVGRETELSRLDDALSGARAGSPGLLFVAGEAGIGKTRLIEAFAARAIRHGARVYIGGCLDLAEGTVPYAPFVAALRPLGGELPADELTRVLGGAPPELGALLPELCGRPPGVEDAVQRSRLFELAVGLFERIAADQPAVLVLEDLHWIDPATRDLLAVLGRNIRDVGLLIIGTYRSDEVPRGHPLHSIRLELERAGRAERIELPGLSREQVARQVSGILGTDPSPAQARSLHARSEGNPFFVEELVAAGPAAGQLPATLREVLLTRVERLGDATQRVLRAVAIIGRISDDELLAAVTGLAEGELESALHEAVAHRLLLVKADGYDVRHSLLREALEAELLPGERRRLHTAVGTALERPGRATSPVAAELARHWSAAGDTARALVAFFRAAQAPEAAYAPAVALTHYERALTLWDRVPDAEARTGTDHAGLLRAAADAAAVEGESDRAVELIEAAVAEVDPAADPLRAALLLTMLGRIRWMAGLTAAAFAAYDEAVALLPAEAPSRERALVRCAQGHGLMLRYRFRESVERCREAIDIAAKVAAGDIEARARNTLGTALVGLGHVEEGLAELDMALRMARDRRETAELGRVYVNYSDGLLVAGKWAAATVIGLAGVQACRRLGHGRTTGMCVGGNTLGALVRLGRWAEADRLATELLRFDAPIWQRWGVTLAIVELHVRRGRTAEAERQLAEIEEILPEADDVDVVGTCASCRGGLAVATGRYDEARQAVRAGLAAIEGSELDLIGAELCALGVRVEADSLEAAVAGGVAADVDAARRTADDLVARCRKLLTRQAARGGVPLPESAAHGLLCTAERTRLDAPDPDAWEAAVRYWALLGEPYRTAYCRFRQAEVILATRSSRRTAEQALRLAFEAVDRLGAEALRPEIEALASRARVRLRPKPPAKSPAELAAESSPLRQLGLTERETEILGLVSTGQTNRQIATRLFISERTVAVHVSHILRKLGVPNRVSAAHIGQRLGLESEISPQ